MNNEIKNYRDLKVWQGAMDLVIECYELVKQFPGLNNMDFQVNCNALLYLFLQILLKVMDVPTPKNICAIYLLQKAH